MPDERSRFDARQKTTRDYAAEMAAGGGEDFSDGASHAEAYDYLAAEGKGDADTAESAASSFQQGAAVAAAAGSHAAALSGVYGASRALKKSGEGYSNSYYRDRQAEAEAERASVLESGAVASETAGVDYTVDAENDWAGDEGNVVDEIDVSGDAEAGDFETPAGAMSGKAKAKALAKGYAAGYAKGKAKQAAKAVVAGAAGDLDDRTAEADVVENGPRRAKNAYRAGKKLYSAVRGPAGRAAATRTATAPKTAAQALRNFAAASAAKAKTAFAAVAAVPKNPFVWIAAIILPFLFIIPMFFFTTCGGVGDGDTNVEGLSPSEARFATYLSSQGLDNVHIAAILGNVKYESGGELGSDFDFEKVEEGTGMGHGLCQWTGTRWDGYDENGVKTNHLNLLDYATSKGKEWTDPDVQLEFFWLEFSGPWSGGYRVSGNYDNPSPEPGTWVSGSRQGFLDATEVDKATEEFCYGFERAGFPRINLRIELAEEYYRILEGGGDAPIFAGGEEYDSASPRQKLVVDMAMSAFQGNPFGLTTAKNWCLAYVADVYQYSGISTERGGCCAHTCMIRSMPISYDLSKIPVGACLFSPNSYGPVYCGSCGKDAGHIAIYIGGGKVVENVGGITTTDVNSWVRTYSGAGWGWFNGVPLA